MMSDKSRILYCHCAHAQAVPRAVKEEVLRRLCEQGADFEAVGDLCEMSARRDPALKRLAQGGPVKIAACFPRAVKWLFAAAGAPLAAEQVEILNMRVEDAEAVDERLRQTDLQPNLPTGPAQPPAPSEDPAQARATETVPPQTP